MLDTLSASSMPDQWPIEELSEAELLHRLIVLGEGLVRVCDVVGQPMAGNYFSMALDILRADADLKLELSRLP